MKKLLLAVLVLPLASVLSATEDTGVVKLTAQFANVPLAFTQNNGQWDQQALYRANAGGATFWFAKDKVCYQFTRCLARSGAAGCAFGSSTLDPYASDLGRAPDAPTGISAEAGIQSGGGVGHSPLERGFRGVSDDPGAPPLAVGSDPFDRFSHDDDSIATMTISASLVGANPNPEIAGVDLMEYKCNYFLGNDPTKWHTDVPNYSAIIYKEIYSGIDLKYYGNGDGKIEYDFIIQLGADPSQIAIRFDGAEAICVDESGQLVVETEWGKVTEHAPIVFQLDGENRIPIRGEYVMLDENTFGFRLIGEYHPELAVLIDPVLSYSTYLGGGDMDWGWDIVVGGNGNAYVSGMTYSTDFPLQDPFQAGNAGGDDAFVSKLSADGNSLIYSTFIGGGGADEGYSLAVDSSGCAYVTGYTESSNFPLQDPFQGSFAGIWDAFVTKLSASGNSLIYSTYLGGGDYDQAYGLDVDTAGCSYVTGETRSTNFPLQNPFQGSYGGGSFDGFVAKLSASGNFLIYSTYLGGGSQDRPLSLAVDTSGCAYVTGQTYSSNFPLQNPFQGSNAGGIDFFVTKLSVDGDSLIYSTYLGGSANEGYSISPSGGLAVDNSGNAYVTGFTASNNFPLQDPFQGSMAVAYDAFVTKLSASGNSLVYSTYLGGNGSDLANSLAVDNSGFAYVAGYTSSSNFPLQNPFQAGNAGGNDAFVTKLSASGNSLIYSTYLGGSSTDYAFGPAVDNNGNAYVAGMTYSTNFPLQNPFQGSYGGGFFDAFVAKLCTPDYRRGDADGNDIVNISDVVYLIAYIFSEGPAPNPLLSGDADCNGIVNISDAVYLVAYIFSGGPAPCAGC